MVHGLDGVHHHQVRLLLADLLHHQLDVRLRQDQQVGALHPQPGGPKLDLPGGFLPRHVQHPQALPQVFTDLQQDGGLADAGIATDEHQRAFDDAPAQHPVQLGEAGVVALLVIGADLVDGHGVGSGPQGPGRRRFLCRYRLL